MWTGGLGGAGARRRQAKCPPHRPLPLQTCGLKDGVRWQVRTPRPCRTGWRPQCLEHTSSQMALVPGHMQLPHIPPTTAQVLFQRRGPLATLRLTTVFWGGLISYYAQW